MELDRKISRCAADPEYHGLTGRQREGHHRLQKGSTQGSELDTLHVTGNYGGERSELTRSEKIG